MNSLGSVQTEKESFALFSEARIRRIPLDEIKRTILDKNVGKKDLLFIAQKRLGIPTGTLRKLRRELIQDRILNEIENIEKFDTIEKKAAE